MSLLKKYAQKEATESTPTVESEELALEAASMERTTEYAENSFQRLMQVVENLESLIDDPDYVEGLSDTYLTVASEEFTGDEKLIDAVDGSIVETKKGEESFFARVKKVILAILKRLHSISVQVLNGVLTLVTKFAGRLGAQKARAKILLKRLAKLQSKAEEQKFTEPVQMSVAKMGLPTNLNNFNPLSLFNVLGLISPEGTSITSFGEIDRERLAEGAQAAIDVVKSLALTSERSMDAAGAELKRLETNPTNMILAIGNMENVLYGALRSQMDFLTSVSLDRKITNRGLAGEIASGAAHFIAKLSESVGDRTGALGFTSKTMFTLSDGLKSDNRGGFILLRAGTEPFIGDLTIAAAIPRLEEGTTKTSIEDRLNGLNTIMKHYKLTLTGNNAVASLQRLHSDPGFNKIVNGFILSWLTSNKVEATMDMAQLNKSLIEWYMSSLSRKTIEAVSPELALEVVKGYDRLIDEMLDLSSIKREINKTMKQVDFIFKSTTATVASTVYVSDPKGEQSGGSSRNKDVVPYEGTSGHESGEVSDRELKRQTLIYNRTLATLHSFLRLQSVKPVSEFIRLMGPVIDTVFHFVENSAESYDLALK